MLRSGGANFDLGCHGESQLIQPSSSGQLALAMLALP